MSACCAGAWRYKGERRRVDTLRRQAFEQFPVLAEKRQQAAGT
jgi:ABC-type branched-subunit amino acid transport system ATPase component